MEIMTLMKSFKFGRYTLICYHIQFYSKVKRRRAAGDAGDFGSDLPTEKTLIKLNRQVIRALQAQQRTEAQWADWMDHAFELEDINKNLVKIENIYKITF